MDNGILTTTPDALRKALEQSVKGWVNSEQKDTMWQVERGGMIADLTQHLFGNVVDVPSIRDIIQRRDIRIVEDCAQAHGAKIGDRMAGTMGDIGTFSFYPTKNLGAYGDAGMCSTANPTLGE